MLVRRQICRRNLAIDLKAKLKLNPLWTFFTPCVWLAAEQVVAGDLICMPHTGASLLAVLDSPGRYADLCRYPVELKPQKDLDARLRTRPWLSKKPSSYGYADKLGLYYMVGSVEIATIEEPGKLIYVSCNSVGSVVVNGVAIRGGTLSAGVYRAT